MPGRLSSGLLFALGAFVLAPGAGRARATVERSPMTVVSIKDMAGGSLNAATTPTTPPPPTPGKPRAKPSARKKKAPPPAAELVALNSHESFSLRPGPQGGFGKQTMRALARFLRCHHTQRLHAISERLARLLYQTSSHFGWARLEIVAGYRAPKIAKQKGNTKSPHKRGVACDFRVAGVTNETVRDYVRSLPRVGVGFYPNSGFVHLDVRDKQSAFWIDYSAPGERAVYSKTPAEDVRQLEKKADPESEAQDPQVGEGPGGKAPSSAPGSIPSTQED